MARFSMGEAVGSGFSLIRRRPVSVFVWGLLLLLPEGGAMTMMLPMMEHSITSALQSGAAPGENMFQAFETQRAMGWFDLVRLLVSVVVYAAIIRAVVRPRDSSFFSLRLGMDELRLAVIILAFIIGAVLMVVPLVLVLVAVGVSVHASGYEMNPAMIVGGVVLLMVLIWLIVARLSLIGPAAIQSRSFGFVEGWRLGRGRSWALFGMMILLFLIVLALELVLLMVGAGVAVAVGASGQFNPESWMRADANPFANMREFATANWPWMAAAAVIASMLYGCLTAIMTAPFASVVRQLTQKAETEVFQ